MFLMKFRGQKVHEEFKGKYSYVLTSALASFLVDSPPLPLQTVDLMYYTSEISSKVVEPQSSHLN